MAKSKLKPAASAKKKAPSADRNLEQDLTRMRGFAELMQAHQLGEITWEEDQKKITLRSRDFGASGPATLIQPTFQAGPMAASASHAAPVLPSAADKKPPVQEAPSGKVITSPFVGTFYGSASPTAEPYVRVGGKVKPGDVLCIVEAMKLMNEIEAEIGGTIVTIHAQNGQPVEFGEPLFTVS